MLTFTKRLAPNTETIIDLTLYLTAEERRRSHYRFETPEGISILLRLPRGTVLKDQDLLIAETGEVVKIAAKPEPVMIVTASNYLNLLRAAYHLGNRHIQLEITTSYLRLLPDSVLKNMLSQLEVEIREDILPFNPEIGAYGDHH